MQPLFFRETAIFHKFMSLSSCYDQKISSNAFFRPWCAKSMMALTWYCGALMKRQITNITLTKKKDSTKGTAWHSVFDDGFQFDFFSAVKAAGLEYMWVENVIGRMWPEFPFLTKNSRRPHVTRGLSCAKGISARPNRWPLRNVRKRGSSTQDVTLLGIEGLRIHY